MKQLIKPPKLKPGDKVATLSLSWGGAGDSGILWRYHQGKERLEKLFGLQVVEMPHTLAGSAYNEAHPEARAADMMAAFADPSIKGVFSCIGGDDTLRLLPFINYQTIRDNPKVFIGYSDTTVNHMMCYKAGLASVYGPALLTDFAENLQMPAYTVDHVKKALFGGGPIGEIHPSDTWTAERQECSVENKDTPRTFRPNQGLERLQGSGITQGRLIGGCLDVLDWLRGTELFPALADFEGAILFLETSEDKPAPVNVLYMLRALGAMGVLARLNGLVFGKPYANAYYEEYKPIIAKALREYGRGGLPVLYNLSFGHCEPKFCVPYGAAAEVDCGRKAFTILESGVV